MASRRKSFDSLTGDLFDQPPHLAQQIREQAYWPAPSRFPLNFVRGRSVRDTVLTDLLASDAPLIVTGYAALAEVVDFIGEFRTSRESVPSGAVRILFGAEPFLSMRHSFAGPSHRFSEDMRRYWLEQGISLHLSAKVIEAMDALEKREVLARYVDEYPTRMHAKIYVGDQAATLGSSNFTRQGLGDQLEANARFELAGPGRARYEDLRAIAEHFWKLGHDFNRELIALLRQLLRYVTWREALARGCAELLEGEWAREYLQFQAFEQPIPLWPLQATGIARAMYLVDRVGSVLVADPTGSGKTRMGAHLMRALMSRIWGSGRMRKGTLAAIVPPSVQDDWRREAQECHLAISVHSHGRLSHAQSKEHEAVLKSVKQAQVLAVDEAHNFLNLSARRTVRLLGNIADHLVLFTATPINRSARDLVRLVDMLGADNFEDETIAAVEKLFRAKQITPAQNRAELEQLRREIRKFTVRRTKKQINEMIARDPDAYKDRAGQRCRYPKHRASTYSLDEPDHDRHLAGEIRALAEKLRGAGHFRQPLQLPEHLADEGWDAAKYLDSRLLAASKLAAYHVMSALRSSRAALFEHIYGTERAVSFAGLTQRPPKQDSGDMVSSLAKLAGHPPENLLGFKVPNWLSDPIAHREACEAESQLYESIGERLQALSSGREEVKLARLQMLQAKHRVLLAFDSKPITLAVLAQHLQERKVECEVWLATGGTPAERDRVAAALRLGSEAPKAIALCSDALSEGVNLQQASAVVHLDMPSVVRIAEQRVGRVDRLDSPHAEIEAWWPDDAAEFALRRDERFVERYDTVEALLGANLPLPKDMVERLRQGDETPVSAGEMIKVVEEAGEGDWEASDDAFEPVRSLVEGPDELVPQRVYEEFRTETAKVLSRVSLVATDRPWAFFCIRGSRLGAPQWIYMDGVGATPQVELAVVASKLRMHLTADTRDLQPDKRAMTLLNEFLDGLSRHERALLPPKKRRLLDEMEAVLKRHEALAGKSGEPAAAEFCDAVLRRLRPRASEPGPDLALIAEVWMDAIRPVWFAELKDRNRSRPLRLKELRKALSAAGGIDLVRLKQALMTVPASVPIEDRIAACILGVA